MKQIKNLFLALAVAVGFGLLGAIEAAAQSACTSYSTPVLVRTNGLTELTGNIILAGCTGAGIPAAGASITITVQPATAVVTNTLVGVVPQGVAAVAVGGAGVGSISASGNTTTIPLTVGAMTDLTISGIRVNMNASGIVFPSQVQVLISSSPSNLVSVTSNILNVGIPQTALTATFANGGGIAQCAVTNIAGTPADVVMVTQTSTAAGTFPQVATGGLPSTAAVTVAEGYASAWHTTVGEGTSATQGTRIILRVTGLQANMRVYVPRGVSGVGDVVANYADGAATTQLDLSLVTAADLNGVGSTFAAPAVGDVVNGVLLAADFVSIVYEVSDASDAKLESAIIPIGIYTVGTPTVATATINVAIAAISIVGTASTVALVPRFVDTPITGATVGVVACVSNVLFPYVVNSVGFDNGFVVANTTADLWATPAQAGTCVYNFYGTAAPAGGTFTTPSIAAGTVDTQLLSVIAPGFEGYVIIQCGFQLAHGYTFQVFNLGTTGAVAQGALGLAMPQPVGTATRVGVASVAGALGFVESLGH